MVRTPPQWVYSYTIELGTVPHLVFASELLCNRRQIGYLLVVSVVNGPVMRWFKGRQLKLELLGRHYGRLFSVLSSELALPVH